MRYSHLCCVLIAGILCAGCATTVGKPDISPEFAGWTLTLNGTFQKNLTLAEVMALPSVEGNGYAVSTVGIRYGPYRCRGVDVRNLAALVGGAGDKGSVWISAPDGYLWVFDAAQMRGEGFITFDENLREIPSPPLRVILMYEQDGHSLTYDEGGPLRIAIISEAPGIVTEGSAWVKWVNRIDVRGS
jgi:DMSO/TMAO reductase YedYZ molybdopterin-dependent catalytic subunit